MTGTERIGAFTQHNLLVGGTIVAAIIFAPLAGGLVALALGFAAVLVPSIVLAGIALFLVFAIGSYALTPRIPSRLVLDVRYDGFGQVTLDPKTREEFIGDRLWILSDVLIVNRTEDRVLLRIRVRIPNAKDEFVFACSECVQKPGVLKIASVAGEVPHLPTEIALLKDEHTRGHTELVADTEYLDAHYPAWRNEHPDFEIEDILTGRVNSYSRETTPAISVVDGDD